MKSLIMEHEYLSSNARFCSGKRIFSPLVFSSLFREEHVNNESTTISYYRPTTTTHPTLVGFLLSLLWSPAGKSSIVGVAHYPDIYVLLQ